MEQGCGDEEGLGSGFYLWLNPVLRWAVRIVLTAIFLTACTWDLVHNGPSHGWAAAYALFGLQLAGFALLALALLHPPVWQRHGSDLGLLAIEVAIAFVVAALSPSGAGNAYILLVAAPLFFIARTSTLARTLTLTAVTWVLISAAALIGDAPAQVANSLLTLAATVGFGLYVGSRSSLIASLRSRAEQADRERELQAREAVTAERSRIARELHDVTAHHVSLLVVQAGAVRESLPPSHPTRDVLDSMIAEGRQAMAELRQMLEALHPVGVGAGEPAARMPQPTLEDVPALVATIRAAGLPIELHAKGLDDPVPEAAATSAYRIVQEALTNVVKHAPGAFTVVVLRRGRRQLDIVVHNHASPLPAATAPAETGSRGLIGMRERAMLLGGEAVAKPHRGGFLVRVRLPLDTGRVAR